MPMNFGLNQGNELFLCKWFQDLQIYFTLCCQFCKNTVELI